MLSQEEYRAFEAAQSQKLEHAHHAPSMCNHERWQITRYNNNLKRYFVTAREEFGTQFKVYADRGFWQGGRACENRMFEELQYYYRTYQGIRVTRTAVNENCKLFEITQYGDPLSCVMILDGERKYMSQAYPLKDGYRYRMSAL
jgi:hypothetical protein